MTPIDVPERFSLADLCCDRHPADAAYSASASAAHGLLAAEPWTGAEEMHRDEPAFIFYTSGTTGTPKGAVLPQRVIHGHVPGFRTVFDDGPQPGDVFWTPSDW